MHVAILATADQMHVEFKICKETLKESEAKLRQGNDLIVCLKNEKAKIEEEKRGLAEFKKSEKRKRLSQEKRIEERLVRDGMVVLESGKTIVTPSQIYSKQKLKIRCPRVTSVARGKNGLTKFLDSLVSYCV